MEATITRFVFFVVTNLLLFVVGFGLLWLLGFWILRSRQLKGAYLWSFGVLTVVVSSLFLFLLIWILTGKSYFSLFAVLTIVTVAMMLVVQVSWFFVGDHNVPWVGPTLWMGLEFQHNMPRTYKLVQMATLLVMLAYPIYIGVGYFGAMINSGEWPRFVIQATLVFLVGSVWVLQLPQNLFVMTSPNLMDDTRSRLFVSQLAISVQVLLLISLFVWTRQGSGTAFSLLGDHFVFAPIVAYLTIGYLLLFLVIPYFVGHVRAKAWAARLANERRDIIEDIAKGLVVPNLVKAADAVHACAAKVGAAIGRLNADGGVQLARTVRNAVGDITLVQRLSLKEVERRDPRFIHMERLSTIAAHLAECETQFAAQTDDKGRREVLDLYLKAVEKEKDNAKAHEGASKPLVLVGLTALASAIMTPVLSAAAKHVAAQLGLTVPGGG